MANGLWIFGNGNRDDSIGISLRYALSRFGLGASQAWVDGLTGMAFSLPLLKNEDCTAWWMEGWNDVNMHFAANSLGLAIEVEREETENTTDPYLARPKRFWEKIKGRLKEGCVVIENTWPLASVIDGWEEECDRPERAMFSGFPLFPNPFGQFYILSKSDFMPDRQQTIEQAIRYGLELHSGKHDTDIVKYGDAILSATKERLKLEHFCDACKNEDFGCFTRTLSRIRGQRLSLAGFVQETRGMQGKCARELEGMANDARTISDGILKMLKNPDLEKLWKHKGQILEMLPF
jgi:hypothetical protein